MFLQRGTYLDPIPDRDWEFTPCVKPGDRIFAGDTVGTVPEGIFSHQIMAPFSLKGDDWKVMWIKEKGVYNVREPICDLVNDNGERFQLTMVF